MYIVPTVPISTHHRLHIGPMFTRVVLQSPLSVNKVYVPHGKSSLLYLQGKYQLQLILINFYILSFSYHTLLMLSLPIGTKSRIESLFNVLG